MATGNFGRGNRPFKKSSSSKSGGDSFRGGDRKSRTPRDNKDFKSKFSKRTDGDARGERKFEKRKDGDDFNKMPHPAFSARKKYFKSKDGDEKREEGSFKKRTSSGDDRKKPFDRTDRRKPFNRDEKKTFGDGDRKRSFGRDEKKSFGGGDRKRSFGRDEKKSFDRDDRKKSFGRDDKKSFGRDEKKSFGRGGKKSFDRPEKRSFRDKDDSRSFGEKPARAKKYVSYKEKKIVEKVEDGLIRLNKFISNSGVCSRREADELIQMGLISVNGQVITELGHKVNPTDDVRYENKRLNAEKPVYILLNKPKGYITTTDDPQERKTVMHLIGSAVKERIYPVGRLDRNTTGLLLLTNDGGLAEKLTHPSYKARKIYRVELDKDLSKNDFDKILEGIRFEEGKAMVDDLAYVDGDKRTIGIEIHIGWNRIVRRIFEAMGYEVQKLDRVMYAGLDKKNIGRGEWRFLKQEEVTKLKHLSK